MKSSIVSPAVSALIALVVLCGCAHISVVGYDEEAKTVTIQSSRDAPDDKIRAEAEKYCAGPVEIQSTDENAIGTRWVIHKHYKHKIVSRKDIIHRFTTFGCK